MTQRSTVSGSFHGWRVVAGAFVLAVLGWGLGFYGPPVYLHAIREARGFSIELVSAAVTVHYLFGAFVVANLPSLYRQFGLPKVTCLGVVVLALGLVGWATAREPWQLFLATFFSGGGWVTMGAAAINMIVSPWFIRQRPKALSAAYNGASIGGVLFSPLWVVLIGAFGFPVAAMLVGGTAIVLVWWLSLTLFSATPASLGQQPDGEATAPMAPTAATSALRLEGASLWHDRKFQSLAAGMALGLFAQIGLLAHLFSLIVPALDTSLAGIVMGLATASAIAGRTAFGWLLPASSDRRLAAMLSYVIQIAGAFALILSETQNPVLIVAGILLFGFGIGNATSIPPLIAQVEFAKEDTPRVIALIVAIGQATYAFAPAVFGLVRAASEARGGAAIFVLAIGIKLLAIAAFHIGRRARGGAK
jgi:MFS family permease